MILSTNGPQVSVDSNGSYLCSAVVETTVLLRPWEREAACPENWKIVHDAVLAKLRRRRFTESNGVVIGLNDVAWGHKSTDSHAVTQDNLTVRSEGRTEYPISASVTLLCCSNRSIEKNLTLTCFIRFSDITRDTFACASFDKSHYIQIFIDKNAFKSLKKESKSNEEGYIEWMPVIASFDPVLGIFTANSESKSVHEKVDHTYSARCAYCHEDIPVLLSPSDVEETECAALEIKHPAYLSANDVRNGEYVRWKKMTRKGKSHLTLEYFIPGVAKSQKSQ